MEQFEKNIKEKLSERKIQPSVQAWDKLEMMLNEHESHAVKKKSPRAFLFIAASILAFVSLGTFFFKMNSDSIEPNVIQTKPEEGLVIDDNKVNEEEEFTKEKPNQSEVVSESKIVKTKTKDKEIVYLLKVEKEDLKGSEVKVNKEIVFVDDDKQIVEFVPEVKQESMPQKVDPKKLLMVAEYEKNVEKSASQFKQMKEKFQEVKTALNNINE